MTGARRRLRVPGGAVLLASCAALSACAGGDRLRQLDEQFAAGWRPSQGYCAWGGETERLAAHCARVNFGTEGALAILNAVNRMALGGATGGTMPWEEHTERTREELEPYAQDYAVDELEWCDPTGADCHRSLLVTDRVTGAKFVLDNGRVVPGDPHVTTYDEFMRLVALCRSPRCQPTG